ncbi:phospholipase D family protein [Pedobacter nyackensis]|uniref:phospholipase D family protein n=1 Tax=Pedobacter nyackensis TaxID=475255 RepID=UPI002930C578|nr:phospholipase D family protein [Pedobacter nyackensis]
MAELINRFKIHDKLISMINEAKSQLILISPYIKLHDSYIKALQKRANDDELEVIIVFGKNKENKLKSLSNEDFMFFKQFKNITIKYCEWLHAKIYANDSYSLMTSMNLHSFSAENNIESGILCKFSFLKDIAGLGGVLTGLSTDTLDQQICAFSYDIIDKYSKTIFERKPIYEGNFFNKRFLRSDITIDCNNNYEIIEAIKSGYCIRTGSKIPFDIKKPYCVEAYKSWAKYGNPDYKEKYCHCTGEASNGDTSFAKPVLKKNLR